MRTVYFLTKWQPYCCEFESRSGRGVQHYVIKLVSDLRQVGGFLRYNWNIVESGVKHHQTNKQTIQNTGEVIGCVQPDWGYFEWTEQIISINPYKLIQIFFAMILKNIFIFSK
jgi:hypothetical protein